MQFAVLGWLAIATARADYDVEVTGSTSGSVWGSGPYTNDSNVAVAAVHAGLISIGQTAVIRVYQLPGQSSYTGSTQNGITTSSYGAWGGSISLEFVSSSGGNSPPSASITGSTSLTVGETGSWNFGASDGNSNLYRWRFHSSTNPNPQWSYVSGGSVSGSYSTSFASSGTYTWVVDVEDTAGASYTTSLDVHVQLSNHAPSSWISGSTELMVGETGSWSFGASDSDGNLYRWRFHSSTNSNPQWSYVSGGSVSSSYSTAFASPGTYVWEVEVEDGSSASGYASLAVQVQMPNHAPSVYLEFDPDPAVVLTNAPLGVTAHAHDDDGNFDAMGVRWLNHNLRQWWDLSAETGQNASRSYTDTMEMLAGTEYFRGEVWDKAPSGAAGDWQAIVVLGSWVPALAITPVSPPISGSIIITYSDAPDPDTHIRVYTVSDPGTAIWDSGPLGQSGDGTRTLNLNSSFTVGQQYVARMFPMDLAQPIAASNTFTVTPDVPVFTVTVYGAGTAAPLTPTVVHTGKHTGDQIALVAVPGAGQIFQTWSMYGAGNGTIANATSQTQATFTVGTTNGGVQAIYQTPPPAYLVTVNGGYAVPAGPQPVGTVLVLHPTPPEGQALSAWTKQANDPGTLNTSVSPATFTVGDGAATVTASFTSVFPPIITQQPLNRNAPPGTTATFTVVAEGTPPLSYQWRKNGAPLADGGRISGATTATLTITSVQASDAATYTVDVSSGIPPSVTSNEVQLLIFTELNVHLPLP